jgi:dienelactone hydrolase
MATTITPKAVHIKRGRVTLDGWLRVPRDAERAVIFAHGSGSGRDSPRNNYVAEVFAQRGLATLLFDLLTSAEGREDALTGHLRFNIPLLAQRLELATDWFAEATGKRWEHIGYFGASTGAAAALVAASRRPAQIQSVVSRGGRPDLAGQEALEGVRCPTLLIVGADDPEVVELNVQAMAHLSCDKRLELVPGATHLFEEPGTLERAADLAAEWLAAKLSRGHAPHGWL